MRSYTPKHLAEKILTSRSALEGERKQVTVLFADVKGSMELAEQVDPEEWHKILDRFFQILTGGVHRFEGTVNQYTGDGIMALFGAPIAHEDHAQRACYAALHLGTELRRYADELRLNRGLNFSVRMGLNSGEVVVGKIGDDLRMDYTAQGPTVGLAARMEQIAEPGKAYLSEHTARLAEGFFRLRDLGPANVKGAGGPLRVYELQDTGPLRTRLDVSRERGFSKFVGRADEMATLELALHRALEGAGQVVGVGGEAGVGKSRLCFEFAQRCRDRGLRLRQAHGVAYGKAIPFLPVLDLLRGIFGVTDKDTDQEARRKIAGTLLLLDDAFKDALPLVFDFLGVPDPERPAPQMDPEARQRRLFAVAKRMTQARSRREPAVTLLEDLHWIDGGTEAFLEQLAEAVPGTRTLLVLNFRPEYHAGWMQKSYYQQLPLAPLGQTAISELLQDLLGTDPSLAGLTEHIQERTRGNPFFIEEVVRSLAESGHLQGSRGNYRLLTPVDKLEVPASVQAVLAARIDRLAEREKGVLQTAAVIGKEFSESVLRRIVEIPAAELAAALQALIAAEFLYEQALYPETEYVFRHPVTEEVAYGSQLSDRRARVHAAVARTIAELYPDKLDERAALLAHHWEGAGEQLEAARWHQRAAAWAGTSDLAAALQHWRRVRELLEAIPASPETAEMEIAASVQLLNIGWRVGVSAEEAHRLYSEGRQLASRRGDSGSLALLAALYGTIKGMGGAGTAEDYIELSKEGMRFAEQSGDARVKSVLWVNLIVSHYNAGRHSEALAYADQALEQAPQDMPGRAGLFGYSPTIFFRISRGMVLTPLGRLTEAAEDLDRGVALAREHGDLENLGWAYSAHVWRDLYAGDTDRAVERARRAVECAEKLGSPFSCVWAYTCLGQAQLVRGQWDESVACLEQALALLREKRAFVSNAPVILAALARARLARGDPAGARDTAEEALAVARRRRVRGEEAEAHLTRARVLLQTGGAPAGAKIEAALDQAAELAAETHFKSIAPLIRVERAELMRVVGDEAARQRELREAHRLFVEIGATGHIERLAKEPGL